MPKLRRTMPIKPAASTAPAEGKWGSHYDPAKGTWVPDLPPVPPKRRR